MTETHQTRFESFPVHHHLRKFVRRLLSAHHQFDGKMILPIPAGGFAYLSFTTNNDRHFIKYSKSRKNGLEDLWVSNQIKNEKVELHLSGRFTSVGLELVPDFYYKVFKVPGEELLNRAKNFSDFEPAAGELQQELSVLVEPEEINQKLQEFFLKYENSYQPDNVTIALDNIYKMKGMLDTEQLMRGISLSSRQLRRNFIRQIGISPKIYAKIIQVSSAFDCLKETVNGEGKEIAKKWGFHDQSHFIKDFRSLIGTTPYRYLKNKNPFLNFFLVSQPLKTGYEPNHQPPGSN